MGSMDQEMRAICEREIFLIREKRSTLCRDIEDLLMPRQPTGDVVLEIRAGTGGSEAALFAANLLDMYKKYAVSNCWTFNAAEVSFQLVFSYKILHKMRSLLPSTVTRRFNHHQMSLMAN